MTKSEILLYQTEDGQTKIEVRLEEETVWLSQVQMAELFQKARSEYEKYKELIKNEISEVEKHFIKQISITTKKIKNKKPEK